MRHVSNNVTNMILQSYHHKCIDPVVQPALTISFYSHIFGSFDDLSHNVTNFVFCFLATVFGFQQCRNGF